MIPGQVSHKHGRRYYILMTTIVVGALLLLMVLNDSGKLGNLSLTGSSVSGTGDSKEDVETGEIVRQSKGDILFDLEYNALPSIEEEKTEFSLATISFEDIETKINLNEEELALKGLDEAEMEISNFVGKLDFDETSISLDGEAEKIKINGITISTKKTLEMSFNGLVYDQLELLGVGIRSVELSDGSGQLTVDEKMDYVLEDTEELTLKNFYGDLAIGANNQSLLVMEGTLSSVSVKGDYDLTLG